MKAAFIQGMKFVPAALEEFKRRAIDGIEAVQRSVDATFETFISQVVGQQQGLTSYDQAHVTPNADIQQTGVLNIANTGFMNNVGGARRVADSPLPHAAMRAAVDGPIDRLMQEFQQYADRFQSAAAFDQALTYFTQIKEQPDRILQLALAGMLEVAKGIVEFALDVAKTIIGLMVDAINAAIAALVDLLTAPWEVPFLSDLYRNYVSGGSDLSILDVCALIHAIPATVIYKLKFKKSPVPDQDAVAAFAAEFAPTRLLRESGIQGTATPEPRGEAPEAAAPQAAATSQALEPVAAGSDRTAWYYLSNAFYSINMFVYAGFEAILDVIPPDPIPGGNYDLTKLNKRFRDIYYENTSSKLDTFSLATLGMEWTAQLFSIPWVAGDGGAVGCTDDTRFGNFVWIYQFIGTGYDTVWYAVTKAAKGDGVLARNGGDVGVIVDTAYGCSHLLLQFTWAGLNHFQDGPGVAQNLLGTLPEFLKFLRHTKVIAASEGWSLVGLVAADIIGDFAACFLNFKSFFR